MDVDVCCQCGWLLVGSQAQGTRAHTYIYQRSSKASFSLTHSSLSLSLDLKEYMPYLASINTAGYAALISAAATFKAAGSKLSSITMSAPAVAASWASARVPAEGTQKRQKRQERQELVSEVAHGHSVSYGVRSSVKNVHVSVNMSLY